jgi:phage shock protein PspC (stress-responsive transcriptional regulator)
VLLLGSPVLFYLVLWAVMPARAKEKKSYEERMRDKLGK